MADPAVHPVDERIPAPRLAALGFQHVLVMYAGAVAVPLIVGRALKLAPDQVAMLISADLFCCGLVTLIQSLGATQWFGIKLPVMMGVTFAQVQGVIAQRCVLCHNAQVINKNIQLHTPELIAKNAQALYQQAVVLKAMPMNNATQITDAERALLKRWFEAGATAQ